MRLILASASPRRLDLLARIGVVARRGRSRPRSTRRRARASCPRPMRAAWRRRRRRRSAEPGALVLAADTVVAAGRRILPKTEERGRSARGPVAAVGPPPPGPFGGHPDRRRRHARGTGCRPRSWPSSGSADGRARRLSRQRRMARQGRRLCDPGPGRGAGPDLVGQPFGRGRPAAVRDPRAAARRRLSAWLSGSTRKGSARTAPSWSRTDAIVEAAIELPGALRAGAVVPSAACADPRAGPPRHRRARATATRRWSSRCPPGSPKAPRSASRSCAKPIAEAGPRQARQGRGRPMPRPGRGPRLARADRRVAPRAAPPAPTCSSRPAGPSCSRRPRAARSLSRAARCG